MKQSDYCQSDPAQTLQLFRHRLKKLKILYLTALIGALAVLVILFMLYTSGLLEQTITLLLELITIICALFLGSLYRRHSQACFSRLQDILSLDCDPAKYLAVLEELRKSRAFNRARSTLALECAVSHYYLNEIDSAIDCLQQVYFRSEHHPLWLKTYNLLVLCRLKQNNEDGVRQAMQSLREKCLWYNPNSPNGRAAKMLLDIMDLNQKSPQEWDENDKRLMKKNLSNTSSRLNKLAWSLSLAEYEILHAAGPADLQSAQEYLKITEEGHVPPLLKKRADRIVSLLDQKEQEFAGTSVQ